MHRNQLEDQRQVKTGAKSANQHTLMPLVAACLSAAPVGRKIAVVLNIEGLW
jgi:hypothetical protein